MATTGKQFYSKAETRTRLRVGRTRYEYLIAAKILAKPISLVPGARAVHTEAQLHICEQKIYQQSCRDLQPESARKMKPLSAKLLSEI